MLPYSLSAVAPDPPCRWSGLLRVTVRAVIAGRGEREPGALALPPLPFTLLVPVVLGRALGWRIALAASVYALRPPYPARP